MDMTQNAGGIRMYLYTYTKMRFISQISFFLFGFSYVSHNVYEYWRALRIYAAENILARAMRMFPR